MQIHEVNDGPQAYPIDQIARSSTKNKTETEKKRSAEAGGSGHIKNEPRRCKRGGEEKPELPVDIRPVENAECRAPVAYMHQVEKAGNKFNAMLIGNLRRHGQLGYLVENSAGQSSTEHDAVAPVLSGAFLRRAGSCHGIPPFFLSPHPMLRNDLQVRA